MNQDDRKMFDVNLSCAECSATIAKLPFEPTGDKPVYCMDCLRARRQSSGGGFNGGPKQMFEVNEKCAGCGTGITQLPFQPSGDRPLYCFDCNKSRNNR